LRLSQQQITMLQNSKTIINIPLCFVPKAITTIPLQLAEWRK